MYRARARGRWSLVSTRTERASLAGTMVGPLWRCCLAAYESERLGRAKVTFPLAQKESPLKLMLQSGQLPYIPAREYGWELG